MLSPEEIKARKKEYQKVYRAENREKTKAYRTANREKINAQNKAWADKHREELNARKRALYAANPEKYNARLRAWHAANPERRRFQRLKDRLGMSQQEYEVLFDSQGGACAICKNLNWNGKTPNVDHDHITGKIRGILCHNCNTALGRIMDDPKIAQAMGDYIKKFK